jgi:uncharacterized membrane protein (UPF0127 family)
MPAFGGHFFWRATMPSMTAVSRTLAALLLTAALAPAFAQDPQMNLPRVKLSAGMHQIDAQVAQTNEQRATGLMWRKEMPQHEGMLFVFEQASMQCFWMKNTLLPLSTAFVADDGTIVNIEDMKPQTLDSHCSQKPVRYVLEMNQGWSKKKGLAAGSRLSGPPFR